MAAVCHKYTLMKIPKHRFTHKKKHRHYFLVCIKLPNVGNFCLLACVCDAVNEINTTIWLGFFFSNYYFCCFLLANVLVETSLECHKIQIFCRWANFLVGKKTNKYFEPLDCYCYHWDKMCYLVYYANVCQTPSQFQITHACSQHTCSKEPLILLCILSFKPLHRKKIIIFSVHSLSKWQFCFFLFVCHISSKLLIVCIDFFYDPWKAKTNFILRSYFSVWFSCSSAFLFLDAYSLRRNIQSKII